MDLTPTQLFHKHFTRHLRDFLDLSPGSLALLVPNVRDIINDHAVFPQCEFNPIYAGDPVCLPSASLLLGDELTSGSAAHPPATKSLSIHNK